MLYSRHQQDADQQNLIYNLSPKVNASLTVCVLLIPLGLAFLEEHSMGISKLRSHWNEIIQLYTDGESSYQIAERFNVTALAVRKGLVKRGIYIRSKKEAMALAIKQNRRASRKGEKHPNWAGRPVKIGKYLFRHLRNHPRASSRGYVPEAVIVAEKEIGRRLADNEMVHHIDKIPTNNDPSNLKVMTRSQHCILHRKDRLTIWSFQRNN